MNKLPTHAERKHAVRRAHGRVNDAAKRYETRTNIRNKRALAIATKALERLILGRAT